MLKVENLSFSYGGPGVLDDLSLQFKDGTVTTLLGANGCGKTTLLNLLTKNLQPNSGKITLDETSLASVSLKAFARKAAIVHQKNAAPDDLTVERLVSYGRLPYSSIFRAGLDRENQAQVDRALGLTDLIEFRERRIGSLSGGQRQRAFIAMALAQNTKLLFLDEPTTYLDVRYQVEILRLVKRLNEEQGITIVMVLHDINQALAYLLLPMRHQKYMTAGMEAHIRHISHFVSGFDREAIWEGRSDYLPSHYSQVPVLWKQVLEGPDVFYCTVSPMDQHGYFSCGTSADLSEIRKKAKRLLLEVNPTMPRTFGSHIHISEVDALTESDLPITEVPPAPISADDRIIGGMIAQEICDGATLQLGIGGIPNAVAQALMDKRDLGIHSEMFCDSIVDLTNAGVITNDQKKIHRGKSIVSFTFGARSTYDFIDDNPGVEFLPVDYVNNPFVIAQNDNVISINSCMEIDLFGQVCSETIGPKNFSGAGGQVDFIRGAGASKGGKSFLAFKSSAKNNTLSKIKPILTAGSCVTTTRNDVDYIVTEQGMVRLKGLTCSERAKALIGIAHPNFREELTREAQKMHLII